MNTPRNTIELDRIRKMSGAQLAKENQRYADEFDRLRNRRRDDAPSEPSWMRERYDQPIVEGFRLAIKVSALVAVIFVFVVLGKSLWKLAHAPHVDAYTQDAMERCIERGGKPVRVLDAEKQVMAVRCDGVGEK